MARIREHRNALDQLGAESLAHYGSAVRGGAGPDSGVRVALLALLLFLTLTACRSSAVVITAAPLPTITPTRPTPTPGPIHVSVDGAIERPGNYTLAPGSLVDDAVHAAGGPAADADLERINLARALRDGDRVHVPLFGEVLPTPTPFGVSADGRVNINFADVRLLETLPGIGPITAQSIVEWRETRGPFETIEEIQRVNGIGPKTFEQIEDMITAEEPP